jgi:hypothetical protein
MTWTTPSRVAVGAGEVAVGVAVGGPTITGNIPGLKSNQERRDGSNPGPHKNNRRTAPRPAATVVNFTARFFFFFSFQRCSIALLDVVEGYRGSQRVCIARVSAGWSVFKYAA